MDTTSNPHPLNPEPGQITMQGNEAIWTERRGLLLAFFCSTKAPAGLILTTHDLAQGWRHSDVTVISGFHTPVEQEALTVLLRGPAPLILCPARSLERMRIKADWRPALEAGRLLLMSPFPSSIRRATKETALARNRFVAGLADRVIIAHAAPGSKTEALADDLLAAGQIVQTLPHPANANLIALGAAVVES